MNERPLISIITVVRNGGEAMRRAIASVSSQTFDDFEHVVIDGASTDGTAEYVMQLKHKGAIRGNGFVASEGDSGIYSAMNKAIGKARGQYLYFLNSDDYFFDHRTLERVAKAMLKTQAPMVSTQILLFDSESGKHSLTPAAPISYRTPLFRGIYQQEIWAKAELYQKHGRFDERFRLCADMDWLMRVLKHKVKCYPSEILATVFSTGGASSNFEKVVKEHRMAEENNYSPAIWLACKVWRRTGRRLLA